MPVDVAVISAAGDARDREERRDRIRDRERAVLADRVGLDLEVEVDADLLEEVVADRDEPDLDRDLEVLEPAELAEQVGDLLVDLRRVADDQADAEEERRDRTDRPWPSSTPPPASPPKPPPSP